MRSAFISLQSFLALSLSSGQLPKNFYDLVEEKKWQLRKEALDALLPLSQTPKISPGDFNELMRVIKKFIAKDTNVMLVALAAQCLAGIFFILITSCCR